MFTLRCTSRLLKRLGVGELGEVTPTTCLGDWYANLLLARPQQLILAVSELTLLPVVIPARDSSSIVPRLAAAAGAILHALGVPDDAIRDERGQMVEAAIGKTANRRVLAIMNEFAFALRHRDEAKSLVDVALWLAETPCKIRSEPGGYGFPDKMTREAFGGRRGRVKIQPC